jgi:hypothetical protein
MKNHITFCKNACLLILSLLINPLSNFAQKTIQEGVIKYNISIENPSGKGNKASVSGTYTITFKGALVRKELKIANGYSDILLFDNNAHTLYSLKTKGEKKYAIQLDEDDYINKYKQFSGFTLSDQNGNALTIAGLNARKATVTYTNGSSTELCYAIDTKWQPANNWTFERFPEIKYLPLSFSYNEPNGMTVSLKAEKVENVAIETSVFKIPSDYKIISYAEYQQMTH